MRALLALALVTACSSETEPTAAPPGQSINFRLDVPPAQQQLAERAARVFVSECPKWLAHRYDIASAVIRYKTFSGVDYPLETYGWKRAIEIEIAVRRGAATFDEPVPHYAGHTFRYLLGGRPRPGIVTSKEGAKHLCNIPVTGEGDALRAVPDLADL